MVGNVNNILPIILQLLHNKINRIHTSIAGKRLKLHQKLLKILDKRFQVRNAGP